MRTHFLIFVFHLLSFGVNADIIEIKGDEPDANKKLVRALIEANPDRKKTGNTIRLSGTFTLTEGLLLNASGVTIEGAGMNDTKLVFKDVKPGGTTDGLVVTGNDFTIRKLTIQNAVGNALKISGATNVTVSEVKTEWTKEPPGTENGPYGIYPVHCKNVLVEKSEAYGASDAGIYLGQSTNAILRNNLARANVNGIEVENSTNVDVLDNRAVDNSGGILIFDLPIVDNDPNPKVGGHRIRVVGNTIEANNRKNFAPPGTTAGAVAAGTGLLIMASTQVEAFRNDIKDNQTASVLIGSYAMTQKTTTRKDYNPFPKNIYVHDNKIRGGGTKPAGGSAEGSEALIQGITAAFGGKALPDILWDGQLAKAKANPKICLRNNGDDGKPATFGNFDFVNLVQGKPKVSTDMKRHDCKLKPLPEVRLGKR